MGRRAVLRRVVRSGELLLAVTVPVSAAAALALHAYQARQAPSSDEWEIAAQRVGKSYRTGDKVAFLPGWAQEGRGLFQGMDVVPQEHWGSEHILGAKRVFVVASFGAEPPAWLRRVAKLEREEEVGQIRILQMKVRPASESGDLVSRVMSANVHLESGGRSEACRQNAGRHDCTRGRFPWRWVGPRKMRIGGRMRRCINAHPTTGAKLHIDFPPAKVGAALEVHHGLADRMAGRGASVSLEVRVGTFSAGRIVHQPTRGWRKSRIDTSPWHGRTEPIHFIVTTPHDGGRHFCFSAEVVR